MVVLIDANVVLDRILGRNELSERAMEACKREDVDGYIAFHSVSIIWYVLRDLPPAERRRILRDLCELLTVTAAPHEMVTQAIDNDNFLDFEDCLQDVCAKAVHADYIITGNIKDYVSSGVPALTPERWLELLVQE
ncbi:MAG: PIN domain-containing protein [Lachnospiraceae bacterium]|nr:PIN domain-containing protein [Lachnospiraceae bacterium]